ncbi:DUF3566 domain-containing protein [Actinomadura sp. 7K534]|uniref:DUF3566 domain-containing protein n=1 Tax=Actinomadura sp. 7K534 TaxID=2530366 RepID=UPI001FB860B1|nr:DUF3566 domain-containing protein [Actinomadura sp. 7K534]
MSTEPGKSKGGPGAGEPGAGRPGAGTSGKKPEAAPGKKPAGKPSKTVAAASAKSGRDETTVEIDKAEKDAETPAPKPGTEETRSDLASLKDESESPAPEIAPVKDTTEPPSKDEDAKPASTPSEKPAAPKAAASAPASSSSSSGSAGWARPAEPSASVSTERTQQSAKPFNAGTPGPASGNSSNAAGTTAPAKPSRPSFARTVLKDRPFGSSATTQAKPADGKPARKAQLQLARLEPWSVMKFSFVMSVVCFVILLVAVIVLYTILSALGVFDAISDTINSLTREQGETTGAVDAGNWFSFFRIFGYTVLVGALNVLLITALSTVGSVIYNLAADLVGGVEVTLKEAE